MIQFNPEAFMECPWCGSQNIEVKLLNDKYFAKCKKCKSQGPKNTYSEMTAVKDWNTRETQ